MVTFVFVQEKLDASNAARVVSGVVDVVENLNEDDEQSPDNLDIIANIYDDIDDLVMSGNLTVTNSVSVYELRAVCTVLVCIIAKIAIMLTNN